MPRKPSVIDKERKLKEELLELREGLTSETEGTAIADYLRHIDTVEQQIADLHQSVLPDSYDSIVGEYSKTARQGPERGRFRGRERDG